MHEVKYSCHNMTVSIETGVNLDFWDKVYIQPFMELLQALNGATPLGSFKLFPVVGAPTDYKYVFAHRDGRKWAQILRILPDKTEMDFNTDFWQIEEFVAHRELRLHVIEMLRSPLCLLSKIAVTWIA